MPLSVSNVSVYVCVRCVWCPLVPAKDVLNTLVPVNRSGEQIVRMASSTKTENIKAVTL